MHRILRVQPQRPARRLKLEPQPPVDDLVAGQPAGEAIVTRRSALAQSVERQVGRLDLPLAGLERLVAPADLDLGGLPGTASQQTGRI